MTATYIVGSLEYVKATVSSTATLSTQVVELKVLGTWRSASWVGAAGTTRVAETLVDFSSASVGGSTVFVRITDTPEVPIINAGRIHVSAAA